MIQDARIFSSVMKEPVGVAGAMFPWNFSMHLF
jgi:acyl-CoA reductase-like NAD-dependent aldehyde dehydrogenase